MLNFKHCPLYHPDRHAPTCRACHRNREWRRGRIVWDAHASVYLGCVDDGRSIEAVCVDCIVYGHYSIGQLSTALGVSLQAVRRAAKRAIEEGY